MDSVPNQGMSLEEALALRYPAPLWGVNVTQIVRIAEEPPKVYTLTI